MNTLSINSIIKSDQEHATILLEIDELMNTVKPNTPKGDRLELLILLATDYENKHSPIEAPDPIEAIKYKMAENGLKQKDLKEIIGAESRISEILNRKRKLTLEMIRNISHRLNISLSILIQDYQLAE